MTEAIVHKVPDGTGDEGAVTLTAQEYKDLTEKLATKVQAEVNMSQELKDLREKNRKLAEQPQVETKDISSVVEAELAKRDAEQLKTIQAIALTNWLEAHPQFSPEEDKDGLKFAAFQKALGRVNLVGIKSEQDYIQVLNDALRLTEQVPTMQPTNNFASSPIGGVPVRGSSPVQNMTPAEQKFITNSMGGNIEKYLVLKAKRPEYVEELLKWQK
jgi:hypothetical protein